MTTPGGVSRARSTGSPGAAAPPADVTAALAAVVGVTRVQTDRPLAPLTTFRVGGPADWLVEVGRDDELVQVVAAARALERPVTLLGGGSNVLVSDRGVRGVVVRVRHGAIVDTSPGTIRVSAGATINGLVRWLIHRGRGGLESWAGTPGTVGGAVHGNAHFGGRLIGDQVTAVGLLTSAGTLRRVPRDRMEFGYDRSRVRRTGEPVVWVEFDVTDEDPVRLRDRARASLAFRKRTQPLDVPSAGCVFQNPEWTPAGLPRSAGALVDAAGLKGRTVGGARVSDVHGNFVVTTPGATARDVRALIERCRAEVAARYDVVLTPEIVFLGECDEPA